ncbi:MAG: hypothetical protein LBV75_08635, partial [Paludibacter sp.]|nr:hypothetical protein [Paludibacter sp.]
MKKLLLFIFISISLFAFGQNTFAPIGAKWYYGINGGYYESNVNYYQTVEVISDTVIAEKQCSVLELKTYY